MQSKRALVVLLTVGLALVVTGCSRGSSLSGSWSKTSGDANLPAEIALRQSGNTLKISYYEAGGVETVTLLCDGSEHFWFAIYPVKITYNAKLTGKTLLLTKHIKNAPLDVTYTEQWSLSEDGRTLSVAAPGMQGNFERRPLLRNLFVSTP